MYSLFNGDCLEVLFDMDDNSVDAIITDPPYGIDFMNMGWDKGVPTSEFWEEMLRVAKPGAVLMAFGGTRMYHALATEIERSGWEVRDMIMWVFGDGMPKSHDIGKSTGLNEWGGYGTGLAPGHEPICVAFKPREGTYATNAIMYGVSGFNIEAGRIPIKDGAKMARNNASGNNGWKNSSGGPNSAALNGEPSGRWPKNFIHDGSSEVVSLFPHRGNTGSVAKSDSGKTTSGLIYGEYAYRAPHVGFGDSGSAARFFYSAKSKGKDREYGLDSFESVTVGDGRNKAIDNGYQRGKTQRKNPHPTVKPIELMRYLVGLVSMPNGSIILDPFMGSGTTGIAAMLEGQDFIGIELNEDYYKIAAARVDHAYNEYNAMDWEIGLSASEQGTLFDAQ